MDFRIIGKIIFAIDEVKTNGVADPENLILQALAARKEWIEYNGNHKNLHFLKNKTA
jgi:hypothetical protein